LNFGTSTLTSSGISTFATVVVSSFLTSIGIEDKAILSVPSPFTSSSVVQVPCFVSKSHFTLTLLKVNFNSPFPLTPSFSSLYCILNVVPFGNAVHSVG